MSFEPIAIVGRACLLPGALDPAGLWQLVLQGRDQVSAAPAGRWRVSRERIMGTPGAAADRTWSDRGGYVEGFERVFSPRGFALGAGEIAALDPLAQWLLHVSREALRDAGARGGARAGAVFGNLSFPSSSMARFAEQVWLGDELARRAGIEPSDPRNRFMSGLPAHLVAQALGLGAGAFCLDAACASSLYAIKLACDRLHDRSADLMLAGAVNRADDLFIHVGFCALQAMSKTGRSRPFHRDADGLVPAEGAGAVVLERLSDAEAAGHRILGVIRGVGLSNDGRSDSLLAPSERGQERAIRAAYQMAGLSPADVSLVECHATGTAIGDAAEIHSMGRVFAGLSGVPIGSLKSNFGHSVTAAGVAGLIKVLAAMEAGVRPPTLHADEPVAALEGSPFRLLREAEPWQVEGPRRAAVSAFGFGGNNAHLIVEQYVPRSAPRPAPAAPASRAQVAIVAVGAVVGDGAGAADFERALFAPAAGDHSRAASLTLPVAGLRYSPRDLALALPQQLWMIAAAREAFAGLGHAGGEKAGAFVGMGCDPGVARYGMRWRMADWAGAWGVGEPGWIERAADAFAPTLESPGVLGTMPNIPANRLNVQYDLGGQGFVVNAEELSGVRALEVAARAVASGELDVALVGAVDLSCDPVHEAALRGLGRAARTGDGAVALVLERAEDARRSGHPILALLDESAEGAVAQPAEELEARFGRAHAAFGLLQVASGALACARGRQIGGAPWAGKRAARVEIEALGNQRATVVLRSESEEVVVAASSNTKVEGPVREYPAHTAAVLPPLPQGRDEAGTQVMAPAPRLPSVLDDDAAPQAAAPVALPVAPPAMAAVAAMPVPPVMPPPAMAAAPMAGGLAAQAAAQHARVAQVHRQFLETQGSLQQRFLALSEQVAIGLLGARPAAPSAAQVLQRAVQAQPPIAIPAAAPAVRAAAPAPASAPAKAVVATKAAAAVASPEPVRAPVTAPSTPAPAAPPAATAAKANGASAKALAFVEPLRELPGLKLDRRGLQVHSSGKISEIFGPEFAPQDGFERQVRMPEPPLLLADRLVGVDARPGSMGTGTLWTETDVRDDSWYLHDGRMPAGIMIESGQADLMLISYLGVDLLNRGERVYRLLGCDLTYHAGLPAPGETLRYDIHVDGHANQGDIRLFFFHYDCRTNGHRRLSVRGGQAGFFTDKELADSKGILWSPETGERCEKPRLAAPAIACQRSSFSREQLEAFAAGRVVECFGPGFELAYTHTRTPRISGGKMLFLEEVTDLDPRGGPWGRGYLRAVDRISPDDWFFQGHFKNDPCMPGTLMFEGCLQAMAFYLTAMGFTVDKDAWRFEPVPEETYKLRCRGQATPQSKEIVYEIFVEEVLDGPVPTLYADLLCTVDGLKAFHCRRMGLQLVPGWPLDSQPKLVESLVDTQPVASKDGFDFGYKSLLSCAWGKPSEAFGKMYEPFDGTRRVARLPGPPYHFMSRVARADGEPAAMKLGTTVEVDYDVPADAWYYDANGARTMPYAVLLEAALQPCGWLASYLGSALTTDVDLSFRNLDGTGTLLAELPPDIGTIRTRTKVTNISRSAGMIIESFDVTTFAGERPIYEMKTVFGFFPKEALEAQKGLPVSDTDREALEAPSEESLDLRARPEKYFGAGPRLPEPALLMLHRISGIWPSAGAAGLGRFRGELDVDPDMWFFKAHFFQDPVQPGSLGIEALLQLLQFSMIRLGLAEGEYAGGRFEPIALGSALTWKYRGQVRPRNKRITSVIDVTKIVEDERGRVAIADGSLWVDGLRIYEAKNLAMRIVREPSPDGERRGLPAADREPVQPASGAEGAGEAPAAEVVAEAAAEAVVEVAAEAVAEPVAEVAAEAAVEVAAETVQVAQVEAALALPAANEDASEVGSAPAQPAGAEPAAVARPEAPSAPVAAATGGEALLRGQVARTEPAVVVASVEEILDPADPLLRDHRPTWTVPALPLMSMVDRLAAAAARLAPGKHVVAVENARAHRWVPVTAPLRLTTRVEESGPDAFEVTLLAWRDAPRAELSRFEPVASGRVVVAASYPAPREAAWTRPLDARPASNPYKAGTLFHGPSFQLLRSLAVGGTGSSGELDAGAGGAPRGQLHEVLLDALTHGIPHDDLSAWSPWVPAGLVAYPHRVSRLSLYGALPESGTVRFETRFVGFDGEARFPKLQIQAVAEGRVVAELELVEVLFPKGPIGSAKPADRRAFLRDREFVEGLTLSSRRGEIFQLAEETVKGSDWLPGTVAAAWATRSGDPVAEIAAKEHLAARARVHPSTVTVELEKGGARLATEPLTVHPLAIERDEKGVAVRGAGPARLDITPVREFWDRYFGIGRWPVEDLFHGLTERFVRGFRLADPKAFEAVRGRGVLYLGNHQVGIESLLFSMVASGLSGVCTNTLAKAEHRTTWLGRLIQHAFSYPGVRDPGVITFFQRDEKEELPKVIGQLGQEIRRGGKSVMVHVEGTRALTCRAPVIKMSGAFLDMAVAVGAPVVPVRFIGGLPVAPLEKRIEFPIGMGRQEVVLGRPIEPEELAGLNYKERKDLVVAAINSLGVSNEAEAPLPGNPEFARAAQEWSQRTGASDEHAVLFETLRRLPNPSESIRQLLDGAKAGRLELARDARGEWMAELARRLFGERGPEVVLR